MAEESYGHKERYPAPSAIFKLNRDAGFTGFYMFFPDFEKPANTGHLIVEILKNRLGGPEYQ